VASLVDKQDSETYMNMETYILMDRLGYRSGVWGCKGIRVGGNREVKDVLVT